MRLSQLPAIGDHPTLRERARPCVACRFHDPNGPCCYPGACPSPVCAWCQVRPATVAVPLDDGSAIELCDDCAR